MIRHLLKMVWNRRRNNVLLSVEIFFSFMVLFLVVVFAVYFADNYRQPLGFDYRNVLTVGVSTNESGIRPEDRKAQTLRDGLASEAILRELSSMPEIESAGGTWSEIYSNAQWDTSLNYGNRGIQAYRDYATVDALKSLKIEVDRGRWFSAEDDGAQYVPLVINRKLAADLFAGEDPLGKLVEEGDREHKTIFRVCGIISEFKQPGDLAPRENYAFSRWSPVSDGALRTIVVRVRPGTPASVEEAMLKRLQALQHDWTFQIERAEQARHSALKTRLLVLGAGALVAFFLILMVGLGMVGVLWQSITRRSREIGVRRALGATAGAVYRQILGELLVVTSAGLALGLLIVVQFPILQIMGWVRGEVVALAAVIAMALIYALALAAGLYPSWLAGRVQPAIVLRSE
jgi:putative ABC transport system permease protein